MKMVDALIYSADDLIKDAEKKVKAFQEAWVERGTEFNNAGMPQAAYNANVLASEAESECITLKELLEHNKTLLKKDKKLDKHWDKLKNQKKMYA